MPPKVSVVIPVYNQAAFLAEAIQSVLDQTYPDLEVVVVNDASSDHTSEVVRQFDDPRLKYIEHRENRGLPATRNTGIRASTGEIIALLDADDMFHLEKLRAHVTFLEKHPHIDVTYNARFELNHSAKTIREISRPPLTVTLSDLVLGFPFAPSDVMLRREALFKVGLFDESFVFFGEDLDMNCRLALAGFKFASVNRALNYRRYHSSRFIRDLPRGIKATSRALNAVFDDSRCPEEVLTLRDTAFANLYLMWVYYAFAQDETTIGQTLLREVVGRKPSIVDGKPCFLATYLMMCSIADESKNHELLLQRIFAQLPSKMAGLSAQYGWAVARGHLVKGVRAIIWDRPEDGRRHLEQVGRLGVQFDEPLISQLTHYLLDYGMEFSDGLVQNKLQALAPYLEMLGGRANVRKLIGCYSVNRAFESYRAGEYAQVPGEVVRTLAADPKYLANRGVLSILARSIAWRVGLYG